MQNIQTIQGQQPQELYLPVMATITEVKAMTELETLYTVELPGGADLGHRPGQFVAVSVFGVGEAPISISSAPGRKGSFELGELLELGTQIADALESAAAEPDVRAVIITGAGRHFSAGADLAALEQVARGGDQEANVEDSERLRRLFELLLGLPRGLLQLLDAGLQLGFRLCHTLQFFL